ncbi:putative sb47, partial [Escherichia coli 1-250-04_S1_C3]
PLADDPAVRAVFRNEAVIRRAGGVECLESWLLREKGCQWPHSDWHSENMTTMRHAPGAIRLCWHCDNQLRDQFTNGWNQWQRITVPAGCCLLCVGISVLMIVTL